MSKLAAEPEGQEWREKAAVYRQHAAKLAKRMGWKVPSTCGYCSRPLRFTEPTKFDDSDSNYVIINPCGHMQHGFCQAKALHVQRNVKCVCCQQIGAQGVTLT